MSISDSLHYLFDPTGLLADVVTRFGDWVYGALFAIVFAETGLVVAPFLPGDSLLFAAGMAAGAGQFDVLVASCVLAAAAILGDAVNYSIGRWCGPRLAARFPRLVRPKHLAAAEAFFERHGGRAVFIARFVPIARTFVPFVAGISRMPLRRFWLFNVSGALTWVLLFVGSGYFFGRIGWVERNITLVILLIVVVSVVPIALKAWRKRRNGVPAPDTQAEEGP